MLTLLAQNPRSMYILSEGHENLKSKSNNFEFDLNIKSQISDYVLKQYSSPGTEQVFNILVKDIELSNTQKKLYYLFNSQYYYKAILSASFYNTKVIYPLNNSWKKIFEINDISPGAEAGIMSVEFTLKGRYAYGLMTSERGTHRLVRISPFDNQGRRQTSFSNVQVWPAMENPDIEIDETDVRMEVFRASGAGGQHVNKTSSAVRLIHEPTGLVSSSQEERSQLQNREKAMNRLKAMVAAKIEEEHQAELDRIAGKQATVGWGSQIRSYVLQPYQMVKDVRTNVESSSVESVLDGDIDEFMVGYLQWRRAGDDS
jgi:protein subunit release factor B